MAARQTRAVRGLRRRFAENLVLLRGRANLSQERVAERASLHKTELSLLERGLRLPRLDTLVKLAGAIEVEPCELLTGMAWRLGGNAGRPGAYLQMDTPQTEPTGPPESL